LSAGVRLQAPSPTEAMRRAFLYTGSTLVILVAVATAVRSLARSRTFQLFNRPVAHVATSDSIVALTFDDGPTDARVDSILAFLQSRDVHATFFLIGDAIATAPDAARKLSLASHELGNHTYTHDHMILKSPGRYRAEIARTDALLRAAGARDPIYFRPPFGYKLIGLPYVLWRMNRTTVTWDIEPESFPQVAKSPQSIIRHVLERVRPGSIILLHPWYPSGAPTRAAIAPLLDSLRARGYRVMPVRDVLAYARKLSRASTVEARCVTDCRGTHERRTPER
jgi:peptidoglycan/xylan/chitin deacetylase (PgdA/CDA1 family)